MVAIRYSIVEDFEVTQRALLPAYFASLHCIFLKLIYHMTFYYVKYNSHIFRRIAILFLFH